MISKKAILMIIAVLGPVAAAGAALGQDTVHYSFHWTPSPTQDDQGNTLMPAVGYEVWLREDASIERLIATVVGDTAYTLVAASNVVQRIRVAGFDVLGRTSVKSEWSDPVFFESENRGAPGLPSGAALQGNYPNPFNPQTVIRYGVPQDVDTSAPIRLEIFTLDGRRVRSLPVNRSSGWHDVVWDGTDDRGRTLSTGMYVSRFVVGNSVSTHKMTMLK